MIRGDNDYALARLHARAGERARRGPWLQFGTARSLGAAIEHLRAGGSARWIEGLGAASEAHVIEAQLRARFREFVGEVARWADPRWLPALSWCAHLVDLPTLREESIRGTAAQLPGWPAGDLAVFEAARHNAASRVDDVWRMEFRRRLPPLANEDRAELDLLLRAVECHRRRFSTLPAGNGWPEREDLQRQLLARLRLAPLTPVHLLTAVALLWLEHESVRGQLSSVAALPADSPP